jgi:hypothetical protein
VEIEVFENFINYFQIFLPLTQDSFNIAPRQEVNNIIIAIFSHRFLLVLMPLFDGHFDKLLIMRMATDGLDFLPRNSIFSSNNYLRPLTHTMWLAILNFYRMCNLPRKCFVFFSERKISISFDSRRG